MNNLPPPPPQVPENNNRGNLKFFLKICRDIHKSRCTTGKNNPGGKFAAGVNYTYGKFATTPAANFGAGTTGVVDTGGK